MGSKLESPVNQRFLETKLAPKATLWPDENDQDDDKDFDYDPKDPDKLVPDEHKGTKTGKHDGATVSPGKVRPQTPPSKN